jgi:hypothetical protein
MDIVYLAIAAGFAAATWGLISFCERLLKTTDGGRQ